MENFRRLIEYNRRWAAGLKADDPQYFASRADRQTPQFLYIGCSDSRVPPRSRPGPDRGSCSCTGTSPTWCSRAT
jgi:carbonic anhydrase